MYRKLCIVLLLIAVSESVFDANDLLTCKETNHVSDKLADTLIYAKLDPEMDDPNAQCYVTCVVEKMGMLRSDGTVNSKAVIDANSLEKVDGATVEIEKCSNQPGEGCKKTYNIAVCLERTVDLLKSRRSD